MDIKELAKEVSKETKLPVKTIYPIVKATIKVIVKSILIGHNVKLRDFATFQLDVTPEKEQFHVHERQKKIVPRKFRLVMILSTTFKKKINAKKAY